MGTRDMPRCVKIILGKGYGTQEYAVSGYTNVMDLGRTLIYHSAKYVIDFGVGNPKQVLSYAEASNKIRSGVPIHGLGFRTDSARGGELETADGCVIPIKTYDNSEYHEYFKGQPFGTSEFIHDMNMDYRLDTTKNGKYYVLLKQGYTLEKDSRTDFGGRVLIMVSGDKKRTYILFDCDRAYLDFSFEDCVARSLSFSKNIDISHKTSLQGFFLSCIIHNLDLRNLDTSKAENMSRMFSDAIIGSMNLKYLNTVSAFNIVHMFKGFNRVTPTVQISVGFNNYKYLNDLYSTKRPIDIDVSNFNTGNVKTMYGIFCDANVRIHGLQNWDVSKVRFLDFAFKNTCIVNGRGLNSWNIQNVVSLSNIFAGTVADTLDISSWRVRVLDVYEGERKLPKDRLLNYIAQNMVQYLTSRETRGIKHLKLPNLNEFIQ